MARIGFFVFIGGVLAAMVLAAIWRDQTQAGGAGGARPATPVATVTTELHPFADVVEALGTARANESVTISSQSTDVISRVAFDSGDVVQAGDVLVELADAEEAADLREARATLEEGTRELARVSQLIGRGIATQAQVDQAEAAVDRARARVASLEAQLATLIIRAPFDGVVGLRNASPGMLVRPGDAIATLDDVSIIKVDFTVPERFLTQTEPGAVISVRAAAYDAIAFDGVISQVDTRIDPTTRSALVRAEIKNDDGRLRPGMLMLVDMRRNERMSPAVPEVALSRRAERAFLYVVTPLEEPDPMTGQPTGLVDMRPVTPGLRRDGLIEIIDGLAEGEQVVSEGVHRLRPGATVRLTNAPAVDGAEDGGRPAGALQAGEARAGVGSRT